MAGILIRGKFRHTDTERRMPCEDCSNVCISQGTLRIVSHYKKAGGKPRTDSVSEYS
jgi:hypothetical protein